MAAGLSSTSTSTVPTTASSWGTGAPSAARALLWKVMASTTDSRGSGIRITIITEHFEVVGDGLSHQLLHFCPCICSSYAARHIRRIRRVVVGCALIDHCVCQFHRVSFLRPACFSMLLHVPGATSSRGWPLRASPPPASGRLPLSIHMERGLGGEESTPAGWSSRYAGGVPKMATGPSGMTLTIGVCRPFRCRATASRTASTAAAGSAKTGAPGRRRPASNWVTPGE